MDTRINFLKIGLFVSLLSTLLIFSIFWLGKFGLESKKYDTYFTFFDDSINGLNIGSSIKYKGLDIGVVKNISINPKNSEEIKIELEIQKGTPIKHDNYAILGSLGITGLKYIELKGGSSESPLLEDNKFGEKVIESKKSTLSNIVTSTEDVMREVLIILKSFEKVLNQENISNFAQLLENSEKSMANFNELLFDIKNFTDVGSSSFKSVKTSADSFNITMKKLEEELEKGSFDIKNLTQDSLNNLESALTNMNETLITMQELIKNLNESPSDLLFKQKSINFGPGEKNEK